MVSTSMNVQRTAFSASTVTSTGTALQVKLEGNADTEVVGELASFLRNVHAKALAGSVLEVDVDMRGLFFMTSSRFKCFLTWISSIEEAGDARRYRVRLKANPNLHWQRRSLDALRAFAPNVVSIEM